MRGFLAHPLIKYPRVIVQRIQARTIRKQKCLRLEMPEFLTNPLNQSPQVIM